MSFDTYNNLQLEILAKLVRTGDTDAVTRCPSWITLGEDELRMALTRLMVRQGEVVNSAYSIASEYTALPTGFYRMRNIVITSVSPVQVLEYKTPTAAVQWDPYTPAGTPKYWTIQNNQLRVFPAPSTTFTASITHFALPSLGASQATNWLLTAHPKAYYKAALAEAYDYYDDAPNRDAARMDMERILSAINTSDAVDQQGTNMRIRPSGRTP